MYASQNILGGLKNDIRTTTQALHDKLIQTAQKRRVGL